MSKAMPLVKSMVTAAAHTPACGTDADGDLAFIAWSDEAALRQIHRLGKQALAILAQESATSQPGVQTEGPPSEGG